MCVLFLHCFGGQSLLFCRAAKIEMTQTKIYSSEIQISNAEEVCTPLWSSQDTKILGASSKSIIHFNSLHFISVQSKFKSWTSVLLQLLKCSCSGTTESSAPCVLVSACLSVPLETLQVILHDERTRDAGVLSKVTACQEATLHAGPTLTMCIVLEASHMAACTRRANSIYAG